MSESANGFSGFGSKVAIWALVTALMEIDPHLIKCVSVMAKFFIFMENSESFQNHSFSNKKNVRIFKNKASLYFTSERSLKLNC